MCLHCLIRDAPVHAGSQLQPKKTDVYRVAPSDGSRGGHLQASSPSAAYRIAALWMRGSAITTVNRER